MAFNVKTFITRSLTSIVFVGVLLGSILFSYQSFAILFFVVALMALNEFYKIAELLGIGAYKKLGFVCASIIYLAFTNSYLFAQESLFEYNKILISFFVIVPLLIAAAAVLDNSENSLAKGIYTLFGIIYTIVPFILLNQIVEFKDEYTSRIYNPNLVLGTIFIIWINDTFAYLGGSFFGKNKMIPRVSPGKTWEGTVFGVVVAFAFSFCLKYILGFGESKIWLVLGIIVPIVATLGDLFESLLKRKAGIKDSGNLLPGHGGILDRFDSLLFVGPFLYFLVKIFELN